MSAKLGLRCRINRAHLRADASAVVFVAVDILPAKAPPAARPPLSVCLAIDASASMEGPKLARAKESALELARQLDPTDWVAVVSFNQRARVVQPPARAGDVQGLAAALSTVEAAGETNLSNALDTAAGELAKVPAQASLTSRVLLLTDGRPTRGRKQPKHFSRVGEKLRGRNVTVTTLGVGDDYNESLLAAVAQAGGGTWRHVADPRQDLRAILREEVASMAQTLVRAPRLVARPLPGGRVLQAFRVTPMLDEVEAPPREGGAVEVPVADLVSGVGQSVVLRVRVPPLKEGEHTIVEVEVAGERASVAARSTRDQALYGAEDDPYPRLLLTTAEGTVIARTALATGDRTEIHRSQTIIQVVSQDPGLAGAKAPAIVGDMLASLRKAQDAAGRADLAEAEKKRIVHDATIIRRKEGG